MRAGIQSSFARARNATAEEADAARISGRDVAPALHSGEWEAGTDAWIPDILEAPKAKWRALSAAWVVRPATAARLARGTVGVLGVLRVLQPDRRAMSTDPAAGSTHASSTAASGTAAPATSMLAPAADAGDASAPLAAVKPEPDLVFARVRGMPMGYEDVDAPWAELARCRRGAVVRVLKGRVAFSGYLARLPATATFRLHVFKGPLAPDQPMPTPDDELDDAKFMEVRPDETVLDAAARAGVGKGTLCLLVSPSPVLIGLDADTLLTSVRHSLECWERDVLQHPGPPHPRLRYLKRGAQLLRPRSLTGNMPQLSGLGLDDAMDGSVPVSAKLMPQLASTRGSSLRAIAAGIAERRSRRIRYSSSAAPHDQQRNRLANPLVALQSSPGGGKSTVLDCAAILSVHGRWEAVCDDDALARILDSSAPITVTFNSGSDPDRSSYDADIESGLSLRILHSFFAPGVDFADFAGWLPRGAKVGVVTAVKTCRAALRADGHGDRGVLLLVDEIIKLGPAVPKLLSLVGRLLDTFPSEQFNAVCTTLDAEPFITEVGASGRELLWAPLPPLQQSDVEAMVQSALGVDVLPRALLVAISDCAGHPRTLQYLLEAAQQLMLADPRGWASDDQKLLHELRVKVTARLRAAVPTWAVRAALTGEALDLDAPLSGAAPPRTLRQSIVDGTFLNTSIDKVRQAVPQLSLMYLLAAADSAIRSAVEDLAAVDVHALDKKRAKVLMGGTPFEMFVAKWLRLRLMLAQSSAITVQQLLKPAGVGLHLPVGLSTSHLQAPNTITYQQVPETIAQVPAGSLKPNVVYTFGNHNAGFGSLVVLEQSAPNVGASSPARVALAFESRFSLLGSPRSDPHSVVVPKQNLWQQQADCVRRAAGSAVDGMVLVYVAVRDVQLTPEQRQELEQAHHVVVLDRSAAAAWLTPTLADRAFFTLDLLAAGAPQQP